MIKIFCKRLNKWLICLPVINLVFYLFLNLLLLGSVLRPQSLSFWPVLGWSLVKLFVNWKLSSSACAVDRASSASSAGNTGIPAASLGTPRVYLLVLGLDSLKFFLLFVFDWIKVSVDEFVDNLLASRAVLGPNGSSAVGRKGTITSLGTRYLWTSFLS